jgi:hypothetical protein
VLAFLFAITLAYEVPYLYDILRDQTRSVPVFTIETATDRVDTVTNEAAQPVFAEAMKLSPSMAAPIAASPTGLTRLPTPPSAAGIAVVLSAVVGQECPTTWSS